MLPAWEQRSIITANLLNPAFCGTMIWLAAIAYEKKSNRPIPFTLVFLILPLVLHKKTRERLPKRTSTKLHDWLGKNDELKVGLARRIKYLVPYTRESLLFLYRYNTLAFNENAQISITKKTGIKFKDTLTDEVQDIFKQSSFIGRWMATFPKESMVYTMFGIQP